MLNLKYLIIVLFFKKKMRQNYQQTSIENNLKQK